MYIDREIVLVHMPKTGGSFATRALAGYRGGYGQHPRVHTPASMLAERISKLEDWRGVPARCRWYGLVRDPFSWYASAYGYLHERYPAVERKSLLRNWTGDPDASFADALWHWTHLLEHYRRPALTEDMLYPGGADMPSGRGLWSCSMRWYYGTGLEQVDAWVRQWRMSDDLAPLCGVSSAEIDALAPVNARRGKVPTDYDREMRRWVREADGPLWRQGGWHV